MPNKFAIKNGDFNDSSLWSLSATGLSATTVPTIGDNAYANTFTVQITGNVACDNIGIFGGGSTAGGTFNLNNGSTLTSNILTHGINNPVAGLSGTNSATVVGTIFGPTGAGGGNQGSLRNTGSGTLNINGFIISTNSSFAGAVINTSNGSINMTGDVLGGSAATATGISNTSTGSVTVVGNLNGAVASAISNTSTGSVTVVGNVIGDSRGGAGIASTNAAANVRVSGNLIGAPNGIPAVYAAAYTVNPVPSQAYIRQANNGTGVGSDAYMYYYTTDALSAFSVPPVSAVRSGVQYANNTLTGTCVIPPVSSVTFGVPVDTTTGTAALTSNTLFDVSIASLTATNSLGEKLKNSATVESFGRIIASFSS